MTGEAGGVGGKVVASLVGGKVIASVVGGDDGNVRAFGAVGDVGLAGDVDLVGGGVPATAAGVAATVRSPVLIWDDGFGGDVVLTSILMHLGTGRREASGGVKGEA